MHMRDHPLPDVEGVSLDPRLRDAETALCSLMLSLVALEPLALRLLRSSHHPSASTPRNSDAISCCNVNPSHLFVSSRHSCS